MRIIYERKFCVKCKVLSASSYSFSSCSFRFHLFHYVLIDVSRKIPLLQFKMYFSLLEHIEKVIFHVF